MGGDTNGSWSFGHYEVDSSATDGTNYYAGLGVSAGDAEVWKWNGTTWNKIGGDGVNGSWPDQVYEGVYSMTWHNNILYAGLGNNAGDGEVWSCNTTTNCTSWTKIAGDGLGYSNAYHTVRSLAFHNGVLYAGMGDAVAGGDLWRHNGGTSWTQVGGDGLNGSWAASTFEQVLSLASDGTNLYAGLGTSAGDADVWRWNGSAWAQIGGDGLNSGWGTDYESVMTLRHVDGMLYAGLGLTAPGDGEVWRWNGGTWTKVGGDGVNSSFTATQILSMTDDGTNLYVGTYMSGGELWRWNGSSWTRIGGTAVANSWTAAAYDKVFGLQFVGSTLFAAPSANANVYPAIHTWNGSNAWTLIGGSYLNNSWSDFGSAAVVSSTVHNGKLYVGVLGGANNAYVYEWDGNTARMIGGGFGLNSNGAWPGNTYETVASMTSYKGALIVGLGSGNGSDSDVYSWNGTVWTKIGGDGVNTSWNNVLQLSSLAVYNGKLYAGMGGTSNTAWVWEYNDTSWTRIGGTGIAGTWAATDVGALTVFRNQLCASNGRYGGAAHVWCYNGSSWTKIAGDGVNGSWPTVANTVEVNSMGVYNDDLYVGYSDATNLLANVWKWDGSTWTQISGGGLNSSWQNGSYSHVSAITVYNGVLVAGMRQAGFSNTGAGDIYTYNGSTWTQIAGDGINSSWGATIEAIYTLSSYKGKLYAGTGLSQNQDALVYSYGANGYAESTTTSFDTNWHHYAVVLDGATVKIYIDGTLETTATVSTSTVDNDLPLLIGRGYGSKVAGDGADYFAGTLDEIRISNTARTSFNSRPYANTHQGVVLSSAVRKSGVQDWDSFTTSEITNGGAITYRLSDNEGNTWKYWNGSAWVLSSSVSDANAASVINANIGDFPVTFDGLMWQALLKGDGNQQVTVNSVELGANADNNGPDTNASNILAFKSNGGTSLNSNAWTNGASPYFTWTAGTDSGAGILGYCLYLGHSSSDDPETSKGLLGASPIDTNSACQFAVSGTSLDLATSGLLGTALSSSNTPYYLNIKAIDKAGNVASTSEQFQFRFDNTAPANPGYVSAPSGFINTKTATITWPTTGGDAASDANSGVAGLQYRIGNTAWYGEDHTGAGDINDLLTVGDGNYTTVDPPDFDNLVDGINTVYFRTWDAAGNVTNSYVTAVLRINTTGAPSEPQNLTATPATNTTNEFEFSWDAPATFNTTTGQPDRLTYCYVVNTLPNVSNCNFTAAGVTSLPDGPYATQPGSNTLYVVGKDDFGAINYSSYASVTFTANTPAPGIPTNIDAADVSVKATSNWRLAVTWDAPANVGAGVSSYRVFRSTDNSNFTQVGSSSGTSFVDGGLSQVEYYYKVRACDSANNCGAFTGVASMIPTGKFTEPAAMTSEPVVSGVTTKRATITWSTDRASDSKIAIGVTSGEYSPSEIGNSSQVTAHKLDLDNLAAGTTYYFQARWTDTDGNTGVSQEYSFTTAPAPVLKEVDTLSVSLSTVTLQFTVKDAVKVELQYGRTDSFGGVKSINTALSESTYELELNGLDDGTKYLYRLVMQDTEGGKYQSSIFSFTTPPRPAISNLRFQPLIGEPTSTQQVTWTTNIPTNSIVQYGKVGTDGTIVQSQELKTMHEMVIRGLEDNSEYFLIAQGRDASGNLAVSDRQVFKTALDTRPPNVFDVVIEPTIRGTGAEARGQIVVSWKTDEPSTSQVAYAEGSAVTVFNNRTAEDAQLTTEHLVIVSDLPPSRVYSIMPVSRDKSNNASTTKPQAAIIGRASDSVLNIVLNTLRKVFGL